jgi:hypothetical protein
MNKYSVGVDYTASIYIKVKADTEEEAEAKAMRKACQDVPYDDLAVLVHCVEQMDDDDDDEEYEEDEDGK